MTTRFQAWPSGSVTMPALDKAVDQRGEEIGIGSQVKESVAEQSPLALQLLDPLPQAVHALQLAEIGAVVEQPRDEPLAATSACAAASGRNFVRAWRTSPRNWSSLFVRRPTPMIANSAGQVSALVQPEQRGHEFPGRQVAGCAEDYHHRRRHEGFESTGGAAGSAEGSGSVWAEA